MWYRRIWIRPSNHQRSHKMAIIDKMPCWVNNLWDESNYTHVFLLIYLVYSVMCSTSNKCSAVYCCLSYESMALCVVTLYVYVKVTMGYSVRRILLKFVHAVDRIYPNQLRIYMLVCSSEFTMMRPYCANTNTKQIIWQVLLLNKPAMKTVDVIHSFTKTLRPCVSSNFTINHNHGVPSGRINNKGM